MIEVPAHLVKFLEEQDTHCDYCRYESDCPNKGGGVRGGPNGPIYPYCCDAEPMQYIDLDALQEAYEEAQEDD